MRAADVVQFISTVLSRGKPCIVAIDGRCGSGKSKLAEYLQQEFDCNVIHMDDFFLRPEQRTEERLAKAGENIDHERFLKEVLQPLTTGKEFCFRPFDCSEMALGAPVTVSPKALTVVEGSYSCHPALWDHYDLRIFCDIDADTQLQRILSRNGAEWAEVFRSRWIPMEEKYFAAFSIKERCDMVYTTK